MNATANIEPTSTTTKDLPAEIEDESNGLQYSLVGDYYLPNLTAQTEDDYAPSIWAQRRLRFLKQHKRWLYIELLITGQLAAHLKEIDEQANEWMLCLPMKMAVREGVTESIKRDDPMRWVGLMNNIYSRVRELINTDIIYV